MRVDQAVRLQPVDQVEVEGFLIACDGDPARLCTELLDSYPPQCASPFRLPKRDHRASASDF